ncbi:MAG: 2Fe-2S iron-sulfur cluster binding domain-containing protein [Candidatus Mcinerneyibacterium aminivorans]|uniref:2Fe-2S iron-sulfur cluster binding domain-containing protein n=1 Tax=Candidatus Mcinerneyibacterium aminivorans TaxID=2703815 RepID=A0A5D0MCK2_9BACT|nr:MAG: 2Fe-2S iron-sulfur cluster binding domain-containing protein [Candidatus Mcinerneyibacterium aminivorans]
MISLTIDGIKVEVEEGAKILDAAEKVNAHIPTLCMHEDLERSGNCGVCIVEIKGKGTERACVTPAEEGMEIITKSNELKKARKTVVELILSNHPNDCLQCIRNQNCELQELAEKMNIREYKYPQIYGSHLREDNSSPSIYLDPSYCIKCGRCVQVCQDVQHVYALEVNDRGFDVFYGPTMGRDLEDSECVKCGQCSAHCPVAAIHERVDSDKVWEALNDPQKIVVAQEAPAVRVALGEEFGLQPGENIKGKMYAALRRLGFDYVFDTNFGADLTIMEEAAEFAKILQKDPSELPLITTCCPSWVDYLEKFFSPLIPHFSSAKSPHQMVGSMVKTYWAEKMGIDKENVFLVSVMPCTAKKYEIERMEHMYSSGHKDVDVTITTREFARMLKEAGIDPTELDDEKPDSPMGEYSGAGTIFGASGGVMEAALRTGYYYVTGEELPDPNIDFVRGIEGVKEGEIEIDGKKIKIAVASGLSNVEKVLQKVYLAKQNGEESPYHFIEVMACRGGCVGGGGQPYGSTNKVREERAKGLYTEDEELKVRESHNNPYIKKLYDEFLGEPLGEKAETLLHTGYKNRKGYNDMLSEEWIKNEY